MAVLALLKLPDAEVIYGGVEVVPKIMTSLALVALDKRRPPLKTMSMLHTNLRN